MNIKEKRNERFALSEIFQKAITIIISLFKH